MIGALILIGTILIIGIAIYIAALIKIKFLKLELYFLCFKIEKHPVLKAMVDDVLQKICETEGITVFHKTRNQMNATGNSDAVGLYIYSRDLDWVNIAKQRLAKIIKLENEYKMPYKEICATIGEITDISREDFTLPRILICEETLLGICGYNSYYSTYFHELGHHFVEKTGLNQSEENADIMGQKLIQEHLPFFFQLMPHFRYEFRVKDTPKLSGKERIKAYLEYYKYYRKFKNTIIK